VTKPIILENGDLKIVCTDAERLRKAYNQYLFENFWVEYDEFYREVMPSFLYQIGIEEDQIEPCHDISAHGHLSNAPGFVRVMGEDDEREYEVMWWYPQYETKDPIEELLDKGEVIFQVVKGDNHVS